MRRLAYNPYIRTLIVLAIGILLYCLYRFDYQVFIMVVITLFVVSLSYIIRSIIRIVIEIGDSK